MFILGLKIMQQQKNCSKTYPKLNIYVMSRSFGVILNYLCAHGVYYYYYYYYFFWEKIIIISSSSS